MDKTVLVNDDLVAGIRLIRALDRTGVPIEAAFWYQLPETDNWRLMLASSWVDSRGSKTIYERIRDILGPPAFRSPFGPNDIGVINLDDYLVRDLARPLGIRPGNQDVDVLSEEPDDEEAAMKIEHFPYAHVYRLPAPTRLAGSGRR